MKSVPVLIVGAGAGGLSLSALLAKYGIHSMVVEKRHEVFIYPKARNLSFRSLEILRRLGAADDVHAVAAGVSNMIVKPTLNSPEQAEALDVDAIFSGFADLTPEPPAQYCPQSRLEPILLAYMRQRGNEARYGSELDSFGQDEMGVTAVVRELESGERQEIRADYLVAADGVHGQVREQLGIGASGYGALPLYFVFIYFRAPWRKFVPNLGDGDGIQVKNADIEGIFLPVTADMGMFITTYLPENGETAAQFTTERCQQMIRDGIGEQIDVEILGVAPWQPYELVADRFQCDRVFFTGDAAHTMPPFKAGGANTAIQSADNLAWKLAAVLRGLAGPGLLATYHDERHPVGRFNARQSLTGPSVAALGLDNDDPPRLPVEEEASMFALLIGYQYHSGAVIAGDSRPAKPDAVALVDELRGQPGTRVPHVWVHRDGQRVSTLDLCRGAFTLFTGADGGDWHAAAVAASGAIGFPVDSYRICADGDVVDVAGSWAEATRLAPDGALLVRPDDIVGWRSDTMPRDPETQLAKVLSTILAN